VADEPARRLLDRSDTRLALVAGTLILALIAGFSIGRATSTAQQQTAQPGTGVTVSPPAGAGDAHQHGAGATAAGAGEIGGLTISAAGYRLVPERTVFAAGTQQPFSFQVRGPDLLPVTSYLTAHEKELHLIVVRRDLGGYQHLHPARAADGTWSVPLTLGTPGWYRAVADFTVADPVSGRQVALTLAVDLVAPGGVTAAELPPAANSATVDGFTVSHDAVPRVGVTTPINLRVQGGTLERYLGSYGHLVVVREGDLAYLHVHPEEELASGAVRFWIAAPSLGRYRAYFDFQVAGRVHTAEFTFVVS
jgi:hypothetical protein